MGKWHGKNKSNKQIRTAKLYQNTSHLNEGCINLNSLIIFYCKICKFETQIENIFENHKCKGE